MSSSRAKNFRRRSENDDANGDENSNPTPTTTSTSTSTSTSSRKQTLATPKPKSSNSRDTKRLSFADDEEDDGDDEDDRRAAPRRPTRTPSSAASIYKLTAAKDRSKSSSPAPPIPSNVQPQTGEYTIEKLRELQKNARPLGAMPRSQPSSTEPVIVLKGLLKPMQEEGKGIAHQEVEERVDKDDNRAKSEEGGNSPVIPDQATINAIRAKRQQLQQPRRPAPDYISLDGGSLMSSRASAGGSSDEEDNDLNGRVALFEDKAGAGRPKMGVFEAVEERLPVKGRLQEVAAVVDDDEEDEEERIWEEEQFRKGLGRRIDESSAQIRVNAIPTVAPVKPQPSMYPGVAHQPSIGSYAVTRSAEVMTIAQQAEVATRALQKNIGKLKETHKVTLNSLVTTDTHLSEALSEIETLEEALQSADRKYVFMQELRDFIAVMCDFLNDKAFYIEELEDQMQKLHEKRALAVSERRAADLADEASKVEAAANAAMAVLTKGSGSSYVSAATAAAQAVASAAKENSNLPVELDEFGRDINLMKRMDSARRAEERERRKARSESKRMSSMRKGIVCEQIEGELSTDESDSESSAYLSSRNELLQTANHVLSDASEEYSKLKFVKERFEGWKKQYPSTYRDAYVSLSAPVVFSPYVRLELLKWDPLYDTVDFFDMDWHKLLFDYGLSGKDQDLDPDDADANLIPEIVEKVALPILHHEIAHCWDMLSTQMTKNAVFATNMVISYVPGSSKALRELLTVVHYRLTEAIASLSVPAWGTVVTKCVPGAGQYAAYRFGMSVRLLRNICLWKNILALPVLEKLALEELLKGKLLPHVKSIVPNIHDAITRTERIVASLSGVWSGPEVNSEPSQKLHPLVDFVAELGRKLEKQHKSGGSEEGTRELARRLKNMLVALNEYDKARAMLKTFQLKEAL
ncbi:transcriptional repressor ILP1-like [Typha angustifolia]|uniref:transcriptional repressor ILP1-like n=1 Tax=Typha angustifolia TaxID=59011 RepID=UPI003C30710A